MKYRKVEVPSRHPVDYRTGVVLVPSDRTPLTAAARPTQPAK